MADASLVHTKHRSQMSAQAHVLHAGTQLFDDSVDFKCQLNLVLLLSLLHDQHMPTTTLCIIQSMTQLT
jgi:hypothetical protein